MSDAHADVDVDVVVRESVPAGDLPPILAMIEAAAGRDGVAPLSEHALLHLRHGHAGAGRSTIALYERRPGTEGEGDGRTVVGYAHLDLPGSPDDADGADGAAGELVVHPDHRGLGHGRTLLQAMRAAAGGPLRVWAHGDLPAARALAASSGLRRVRSLWRMHLPATAPLPEPPPAAPGVRIRTFEPGRDEAAWVAVNGAAFADHPEQGAWTVNDLLVREHEPWFDPAGFFVAERASDGEVIGFHWTKVHPGGEGEVYVVGVSPAAQGMGLGRLLTLTGVRHLRNHGHADVMLYVDEDKPARRLYESLGFVRSAVDVMYRSQ